MLSWLPVANECYLLSGNMPKENVKCYKITLNYIFAGNVSVHIEQVFSVWERGFEDSPNSSGFLI